ncbi:hypothetical protein T484DRAFT_1813449, partial [Baffinella frigidus]
YLPDSELWECWDDLASEALVSQSLDENAYSEFAEEDSRSLRDNDVWRRTVALTGAVASEIAWQAFEVGGAFAGDVELMPVLSTRPEVVGGAILEPVDLSLVPPLPPAPDMASVLHWPLGVSRTLTVGISGWQIVPFVKTEGLAATADVPLEEEEKTLAARVGEPGGAEASPLPRGFSTVLSLDDMVDAGAELGDVEKNEIRAWIALDSLMHTLAGLVAALNKADGQSRSMPVPTQLLHLLPPTPPLGWPEAFSLQRELLPTQEETSRHYPAARRQQRFSYLVFTVLGEKADFQQVLRSKSTTGRLALAVQWSRDLNTHVVEVTTSAAQHRGGWWQVLRSKSTAGRLALAVQWFTDLNMALRQQSQGGDGL